MISWLSSDQSRTRVLHTGVLHKKESHKYKLSYNGEENPKLGYNHRYVKFLTNGLKASRNRKITTYSNIVTN